jgi:hypothetical protein
MGGKKQRGHNLVEEKYEVATLADYYFSTEQLNKSTKVRLAYFTEKVAIYSLLNHVFPSSCSLGS